MSKCISCNEEIVGKHYLRDLIGFIINHPSIVYQCIRQRPEVKDFHLHKNQYVQENGIYLLPILEYLTVNLVKQLDAKTITDYLLSIPNQYMVAYAKFYLEQLN